MKSVLSIVMVALGVLGFAIGGTAQQQLAKVYSVDGRSGEEFGGATSLHGGTLLVGAEDNNTSPGRRGAAYVFERDHNGTPANPLDDRWVQIVRLLASDGGYQHFFGDHVSLEADTAVVGARFGVGRESATGAVYVFEREDNGTPADPFDDSWIETHKLFASDGQRNDRFSAARIDGNTIFVGATGDDDLNFDAGAVYVFERDDNGTPANRFDDAWIEVTKFVADDASTGRFGVVSSSGNSLVVGARFTHGSVPDSGAAYAFERDDNWTPGNPFDDTWIQTAKLTASDARPTDNFGSAVSIFGDTILVGAFSEESIANRNGAAYVYERDDAGTPLDPLDDEWVETNKLLASDVAAGAQFGISVFVGDDVAIVGGNNAPGGIGGGSGAAYLFYRDNRCTPGDALDDEWLHVGKLTAEDPTGGNFGVGCSLGGGLAVVGSLDAEGRYTNTGAVYVYDLTDFQGLRQKCIGFELEDDDETPLFNGQDVSPGEEFGRYCTVGGTSSVGLTAAIFDSRSTGLNLTSTDPDLLVDLGNVLIAQERFGQTQPGYYDFPDDDRHGGDFEIEFLRSPVRVLSIDLIDIDPIPYQAATVVLVDEYGRERTFFVPSGWTEDIMSHGPPGYRTLELCNLEDQRGFLSSATATEDEGFDAASVVRMRVHFDGSAALDNVNYCWREVRGRAVQELGRGVRPVTPGSSRGRARGHDRRLDVPAPLAPDPGRLNQ